MLLSSATYTVTFTYAIRYCHDMSTAFVIQVPISRKYSSYQDSCRSIFGSKRPAFMTNNSGGHNNKPQKNQNENESLLDKQLFDPDSESNRDNWFANLVKNDYDAAEALYVGVILIAGVIVSQELLRIVKYGAENYIPFSQGGGGNLF